MRCKTGWWVLATLLLFAAPAEARQGQFGLAQQAGDTARLIVERSRVYWQTPEMAKPDQVDSAGQAVSAGDVVSTDGLGRARLSLAADAVATAYHDTVLSILDVPSRHLQLDEGTLFLQTDEKGSPAVIETSDGRVETTGRVLVHRMVDHRHNRNGTWVLVHSGQARVDGGGAQVTLGANQQTWMVNAGRPEKPLEARRDLIGSQFYLIDDLTNGVIMDEDLLASGPLPHTSFPLALILTIGAVAMVGVLITLTIRSRPRMTTPAYPPKAAPLAGFAPASLFIAGDKGQGRQVPIGGGLSMGRAPDNQLPIVDPLVSSYHARILVQGGETILEDLGSKNGTFVNDQQVMAHRLQNGDQIRIGQIILTFQSAMMPRVAPNTPPAAAGRPRAGVRLAEGHFIVMRGPMLTIGRAPDNQVVVADQKASSHHAHLVVEPAGVAIEDLGSTNGTFVNGQRVSRQLLTYGDRIRVGQTELIFQIGSEQEGEL